MKERYYIGGVFISLGIIFLLANFHVLTIEKFWPVFILGPGVCFIIGFILNRKNYGLLMPGCTLSVIGIIFFCGSFFGWDNMQYLWPFFIIAPGTGLFALYYFGNKDKPLLIPATILTSIGCIFLAICNAENYALPIIFIVIGLWLLFIKNK